MHPRYRLILPVALAVMLLVSLPEVLLAQASNNFDASQIRPGGYLSWVKLLCIAVVFLIWVRLADWVNRDAMKIGAKTKMTPEFWNPIIVFSFLLGFLGAISIPIFLAGYPVYVLTAFLPIMLYYFGRRSKIKENPGITRQLKAAPGEAPEIEALPQDEGVDIDFSPSGADKTEQQANLIRARATGGFKELKELISQAQFKRTEQMLLDFTRDSVGLRIFVDGMWHALDPLEREPGDKVLESLKHVCGMNAMERRARQSGKCKIKSDLGKADLVVTSQGVQTGERVQVKFAGGARKQLKLNELGMFPEMVTKVKNSLDTPRLTIISAPPGQGLTSSWQGALLTSDRLTRDCIAVVDEEDSESAIENIVIHMYDESSPGKDQLTVTKGMLLTQPDMLVYPKVENAEVFDVLTEQVNKQDRALALVTPAKSATEAMLRMYSQVGNREQFLDALGVVTCQRLVRRLCDACKTEIRVQPQVIKQLGGDPRTQGTVYNAWKLPPPEQRIDENGKEIEFPPCSTCGGIGYIGRIAIFEVLEMSDQLRQFIKQNPKLAAVESAAMKLGKKSIAQQAYQLVLLGVTSMAEVQTVLKQK